MRTTTLGTILLMAAVLGGCEHKSKRDDQPAASGTRAATPSNGATVKASDTMAAEPVAKDPNGAAAPSGGGDGDVRPPVAADLAEYTKGMTGNGPLTATIETNKGTFHCELFGDKAPMTVANFVGLATGKKAWKDPQSGGTMTGKPFYDGLKFHRVIPAFMIQGGDPMGVGTGGPGYAFDDEIDPSVGFQEATLAMANAGKRGGHGTNGSQFFITEIAPTWLNGKHTIFGQCKELDLVKTITALHGPGDRPTEDVIINHVTIAKGS